MSLTKNKQRSVATTATASPHGKSGRGGRSATVVLSVTVCALAVVLVIALHSTRWEPGRDLRPSSVNSSPSIAFDKIALDDHTTGVRVANVQVVDFDRDGLND